MGERTMEHSPRRLVRDTLNFESPHRIPRQTWILPWAEQKHGPWIREYREAFPDDLVFAPAVYRNPPRLTGDKYTAGLYIDEWGCEFQNPHDGTMGVVKGPLIADWSDLEDFAPPDAVLSLDREAVDSFCRDTECFVLAGTWQRPLERFQFIRTMEQSFMDLVERPSGMFDLLRKIDDFYLKEVDLWASTDVDAVCLMDDWGTQTGLMTSPEVFREIFKPMYRRYADLAHQHGKYLFMHSDGYILDIIPDLIEIGVDALNSQVFCMGPDVLGQRFRGSITFWGEIDRQDILPNGTREDVKGAVRSLWENLSADGGIIAQCEFGLEAVPENVRAVMEEWDRISKSKDRHDNKE